MSFLNFLSIKKGRERERELGREHEQEKEREGEKREEERDRDRDRDKARARARARDQSSGPASGLLVSNPGQMAQAPAYMECLFEPQNLRYPGYTKC